MSTSTFDDPDEGEGATGTGILAPRCREWVKRMGTPTIGVVLRSATPPDRVECGVTLLGHQPLIRTVCRLYVPAN